MINKRFLMTLAIVASAITLTGCMHGPLVGIQSAKSGGTDEVAITDFNGVWETADPGLVVRPEGGKPPYTAAAQKWIDDFKRNFDPVKDDTALFCGLQGMPWTMTGRARTYPVEIQQTSDRINMFFEVFDSYRTIRVGGTVPKNAPSSINGYSVARWDGSSLIVTTTALSERPYPNLQLRSEQARVTERWTRAKDPVHGDILIVHMQVEDPVIYARPVEAHKVFKRSAPGTVVGGYDCPQRLWQEHVSKRLEAAVPKK